MTTLRGLTKPHRNFKHGSCKLKKNATKKQLYKNIIQKSLTNIDNIYNMGNFSLTPNQITVLNKGMSFVGAPEGVSESEICRALDDFERRMLIHFHFHAHPIQTGTHPFRKPSNWQPPICKNKVLQDFFQKNRKDILNLIQNPTENPPNLNPDEILALKELKNNKSFIIKPADKGGKIVLWPTQDYLNEAQNQLGNATNYAQQPLDYTNILAMEIETFLTHLESRKLIDRKCHQFLSPTSKTKTPTFYMLPKIHKPNCPGRPIISGCQSPTRALSQYLDFYLKPIVKLIPSYVKDTNHLLLTILNPELNIQPGDLLVTLDVKSLYTNIPQDEGMNFCLQAMEQFYQDRLPLPMHHLKQMFTFILKRNYFEFNGTHYLQIHGTAMGSPFAPNFANIFMKHCEEHILTNAPNNLTPIIWKRYIDDIFMVWKHGPQALEDFLTFCNQCFSTIKFTAEISNSSINFLDTTIFFNSTGLLESTLFVKPNDICTLLHNNSFHPESCKRGIIYSQALRYRRIITDNKNLREKLGTLRDNLLRRGYNLSEIYTQFKKVEKLTQSELLHKKQTKDTNNKHLPFIIPYDNTTIHIGSILKNNWQIISNDETLNTIWSEPPFLALKRHKNTKDILVRSKFETQNQ